MKWVERIGVTLGLAGMALVLFGGGRWASGTDTELTTRLGLCGIVLTVVGVLMVNFNSDWLFKD